ncbi:MAG: hypothetical protein WC647_17335 [Desulfomonilaceae bacterium]|jgi:hypothetical protein
MPEIISNIGVPSWTEYCRVLSLSTATPKQKAFYEYWCRELENGFYIDLGSNLTYIFAYLIKAMNDFVISKDIKELLNKFAIINLGYDTKQISTYISAQTCQAHLSLGDYDGAWKYRKAWIMLFADGVLNIAPKCTDSSIDGEDLLLFCGRSKSLSGFGKQHKEEIISHINIFLEDFHKIYGRNFIDHFCREFSYSDLTPEDLKKLKEFYPKEDEYNYYLEDYLRPGMRECYKEKVTYYLLSDAVLYADDCPSMKFERIPQLIEMACKNEGVRIIRESENTAREEIGVPRIGEGWVSEATLFRNILDVFPNEKIIHHGRPSWLSPQHLDIYFPNRSLGIEYQGEQHQKAHEFFGGEEGLKKRQKLDKKKAELCHKNNCRLVYVYEDYDLDTVIKQIWILLSE